MLASKLTTKYQATIPEKIRQLLDLNKGDKVAFNVEKGKILLSKVKKTDHEYLKSLSDTFSEWDSEEDDEAYRNL
jgi:antitoxin PrlF